MRFHLSLGQELPDFGLESGAVDEADVRGRNAPAAVDEPGRRQHRDRTERRQPLRAVGERDAIVDLALTRRVTIAEWPASLCEAASSVPY